MAKGSKNTTRTSKFWVSNESMQLKEDIVNIANNLGESSYSNFLRKEIVKIRNSYPENMRRRQD